MKQRRSTAEVRRDDLETFIYRLPSARTVTSDRARSAMRAASPDQVAHWRRVIADATAALDKLDRVLRGADETVCEDCGGEFVARRSDARFCSGTCRQRAHRVRNASSRHGVS